MRKNQRNKSSKRITTVHDKPHNEVFSNVMFDHITCKQVCLKCNNTNICKCDNKHMLGLGKIARPPKKGASRAKWKDFYQYLVNTHRISKHADYNNIVKKYNLKEMEK